MNHTRSKLEVRRLERESSTESTESTYGSLDDCSVVKGVTISQRGSNTGDSIIMTPEEKLVRFNSQAQTLVDAQKFDACIQDLVRCVALTRLVHGDGHLKLAQAHARLAKAYFQFKGWGVQAQEHAAKAAGLLPDRRPLSTTTPEERLQVLSCLLGIYQTQGGAALLLDNLVEAELCHKKAEGIVGEIHQLGGMSKEERREAELDISTSLSSVLQRQGRSDEALGQCERSLELLKDWERPGQVCSVYRGMAAIQQSQGRLDRAIEHLTEAHAIAVSQIPGGLERARVAHSLALALSTAAEAHHNDSADHYFEESLSTYRSSLGPEDAVTLSVQDDYCRFLLLTGQQQSVPQQRCLELQRTSLPHKRAAFGDLSAEVAETLQLIGVVEMSQGQVREAHRSMKKCVEIQSVLYGSQHKKTRAAQKTVDMLAQAPEVAGRQGRDSSVKKRPPFCAVLPSYSTGTSNTL